MALESTFIDLLNSYFNATKDSNLAKQEIEKYLHIKYDGKFADFQNDFYELPMNEDHKMDLLLNLGVHPSQWVLFINQNISLHTFLNRLSKEGMGPQFPWLLDYIEWKKIKRRANYLVPILPILPFSIVPVAMYANDVFNFMVQYINYMPILGIVGALAIFALSYYYNDSNLRVSDEKIKREKYFLIATNALLITGKILLVFAEAILVSIAQYLFLASALISVFSKLVHLRELYKKSIDLGLSEHTSPRLVHQKYARLYTERIKERNELIINIVAALLVLGLTLFIILFPPNFLLTIGISASTFLIFGLELLAIKINERYLANALHKDLADIGRMNITKVSEVKDYEAVVHTDQDINTHIEPLTPKTVQRLEKMCSISRMPTITSEVPESKNSLPSGVPELYTQVPQYHVLLGELKEQQTVSNLFRKYAKNTVYGNQLTFYKTQFLDRQGISSDSSHSPS